MQTPSDIILLRRWRERRDAESFRTLTQRYGGLVWGICYRILKNPADAEEVTQDCFLKLATHPTAPQNSVGPWLHSVAVRASLDRVRAERRRRDRESVFETAHRTETSCSGDLLAHVDEAINALPEELREAVVRHFLEQRSQVEVANDLGISPRTVRRRTTGAIELIRESLRQRGVKVSAGTLAVTLTGFGANAAPPTLAVNLGKLALGGEAQAASVLAADTAMRTAEGLLLMKKAAAIITAMLLAAFAAWWYIEQTPVELVKHAAATAAAEVTPRPPSARIAEPESLTTLVPPEAVPPTPGPEVDATPWSQVGDTGAYIPTEIENPARYGTVTGIVLDESGVAIPGADVQALFHSRELSDLQGPEPTAKLARERILNTLWENSDFRRSTLTGIAGTFAFDAIPYEGAAVIAASAPGYTLKTTNCSISPETTTEVSLALQHALAIHGEVVTQSGQPLVGAMVGAEAQVGETSANTGAPPPEFLRVQTDKQGFFTIWLREFGVEEEMYTALHLKTAEYGEVLFHPVPIGREERVRLTMKSELGRLEGEIRTGETESAAGYHVLLLGTGQLSAGGAASLPVGQGILFEAVTDAEGRYEIEGITTSLDYEVTLYTSAREEVTKQQLQRLKPGETAVWNYNASPPFQVTGVVRGTGTSTPIPGATVYYRREANEADGGAFEEFVKCDENGSFAATITSGEGTYRFVPRHQEYLMAGQGVKHEGQKIVNLRTDEDTHLVLELPLPWTRQFLVLNQLGQPVEGVRATMGQRAGESTVSFGVSQTTDAEGLVVFHLLDPRTETDFSFRHDGYLAASVEPSAGEPGETLSIETVMLYQSAGLSALLTDASGNPLAGEFVTCTASYGGQTTTVQATTDSDGWLVLDQALPGTMLSLRFEAIAASGDSRLQARIDSLELTPGMTRDLETIPMFLDTQHALSDSTQG